MNKEPRKNVLIGLGALIILIAIYLIIRKPQDEIKERETRLNNQRYLAQPQIIQNLSDADKDYEDYTEPQQQ